MLYSEFWTQNRNKMARTVRAVRLLLSVTRRLFHK